MLQYSTFACKLHEQITHKFSIFDSTLSSFIVQEIFILSKYYLLSQNLSADLRYHFYLFFGGDFNPPIFYAFREKKFSLNFAKIGNFFLT